LEKKEIEIPNLPLFRVYRCRPLFYYYLGCIEAPIQLLLTIYLILLGLLEVPSFLALDYGKDQ